MRKQLCQFALFVCFSGAFVQAWGLQSSSPEGALEEMVTAKTAENFIHHLPVKVQHYLEKLPQQQRAAAADKFLITRNLEREGGTLARIDDSTWELVEKEGAPKVIFRLKRTFISGVDALVQIEIKEKTRTTPVMVGMRFEENEWRVTEIGEWRGTNVESEFLTEKMTDEHDASPVSMLRLLNTTILTYATTYPEMGYPVNLAVLAGEANHEPNADHARLVDPNFLQQPAVQNGYEFRYLKTAHDHYQITAIPQQFTEGTKSFFTDETAVIRFTTENRPATANDPPVE